MLHAENGSRFTASTQRYHDVKKGREGDEAWLESMPQLVQIEIVATRYCTGSKQWATIARLMQCVGDMCSTEL